MDRRDPEAPDAAAVAATAGRLMGSGGFGVVQEGLWGGQRVAIKRLRPELLAQPHRRARLRKEAQVLRRLSHPHIGRLLAVEEHGGELALVMEYIDGAALTQRLHMQGGPLPVPLAVRLGGQAAAALAYAHGEGVVHRDIKPDNILLVREAAGEAVRLVDFGVAKAALELDEPHTRPETGDGTLGTTQYMAPEQLRAAGAVDGQADVYALGVVLYEALTGVLPYGGPLPAWSASPPDPETHNSLVPGWLGLLVRRMLALDPAQRPTMQQVAQALRPLPAGLCPFPGLQPFAEDQAALFHGRQAAIDEALPLLGPGPRGHQRWLQIEGSSGSGKSSLLRAGLVPAWRQQGHPLLLLRPGRAPLLNLAQALLHGAGADAGTTLDQVLRRLGEPQGLRNLLRERFPPGARLILALDAFEEVFAATGELAALDQVLAAALADVDGPLHLVTVVRSDCVGGLAQLPLLEGRLNLASRYYLPPMDRLGLRETLLGPCARAGLRCEPELLARLLADTGGRPGCLPLLGHTLRALYEGRQGDALTLTAYERLGGVGGALTQATDELLAALGPAGRERARGLLLSLVRSGRDGEADTRRPQALGDALAAAGGDALAERVLRQLSGGRDDQAPAGAAPVRLVVQSGDQVELIHEALLQHLPVLRQWVDEDRRLLELRDELDRTAATWQSLSCPHDSLATGKLLGLYEGAELPAEARRRLGTLVSPVARRFLRLSRQRQRRGAWLRRATVAALALALAFAVAQTYRFEQEQAVFVLSMSNIGSFDNVDFARDHMAPADAEQFYRTALDGMEAAAMLAPDLLPLRQMRARAFRRLGDLAREQGRDAEAVELLQKVEPLLADRRDTKSLVIRAEALWRLGELRSPADPSGADALVQKAEGLLHQAHPKQENLGFLYPVRAEFARRQRRFAEAERWFQEALRLQRALVQQYDYHSYPWQLGRILTQHAKLRIDRNDRAGAQSDLQEAQRLLRKAVDADPNNRRYQRAYDEADRLIKQLTP